MLSILLIVPLLGCIGVSFSNSPKVMKQIALYASVLNFIISVVIWSNFNGNVPEGTYQFTQEFFSDQITFCHFYIGIDGVSLYFVLLTTFIIPISILSNWENISSSFSSSKMNNNESIGIKYFLICFLALETLLIAVFVVLDILLFYVFFESVLIPLFFIVGIWGGGPTRIRAAFLLFLYTLFGSLFMLLAFVVIYYNVGSTDFQMISLSEIDIDCQKILFLAIFVSIAVKTPIVPFNTWLTYAHSEAPVGGSIVLAGVILKLATYGFIRIVLQFLPDACSYYSPLVQVFAIISVIYASLSTLRQTDFKKLVAYSSVSHVAVVVLGLFSNTVQGIEGAIMLSLAHGLVSPALFFLVGGVLYDRYHTRTIRYYRGLVTYMPLFALFFFVFTIFNAAVPLSANWIGETLCLIGTFQRNPLAGILGATGIVLSAAYSIWLYNRITFGTWSPYLNYTSNKITLDINRREYIILLPLLIISVIFGIYPNIVLNDIHNSVSSLIYVPV